MDIDLRFKSSGVDSLADVAADVKKAVQPKMLTCLSARLEDKDWKVNNPLSLLESVNLCYFLERMGCCC